MAKAKDASQTPLMRQYLGAKAAHPDALLFFRLGDFYELFFEDAVVAARALDLTLTSRNKNAEDEVPMAGVPHHAASSYIQRLTELGYRVALCEQMADPQTVKGIVPREVVRVVTPALVFDDAALEGGSNAYVVAVEREGEGERERYGVAAYDGSTGELSATDVAHVGGALSELTRLEPREVLLGPGCEALDGRLAQQRPKLPRRPSLAELEIAEVDAALRHLVGAGDAGASELARRAAARVVRYAEACEPGRRLPVERLASRVSDDTLVLDASTQEHLELVRATDGEARGSLLAEIDATKTAMGARLLRARVLAPSAHLPTIRARHEGVELFVTNPGLRAEVRARLARVADLERLAVRVLTGRALPRDLVLLGRSLAEMPCIIHEMERSVATVRALGGATGVARAPGACEGARQLLARALADEPGAKAGDGDVLREGYDAELDEARALAQGGQGLLVELEGRLRVETQISSLKLRYTRVFGWYIELTKTHVAKAPRSWRRKQTVATGERYTCDELDELSDKVAHATSRVTSRETELFAALLAALAAHDAELRDAARSLAEWDVASALAEVAHSRDYVRPLVDHGLALSLVDGRHPVVERLAAAGAFVPNDVSLDAADDARDARLWLVSGPNMAGKSTFMRQVALAVILAQMGGFVPAAAARVGLVDRILTRVGASDNLSKGESTFMVEMKETANVLLRATRRSLVILDEIGRGTSTYDGLSIAWAVAEHLAEAVRCRALFATHYHELTALGDGQPGCANRSVSAREHDGDIVFFHKVGEGAASRSYGVACARLAGLPESVLRRARAILDGLETRGEAPRAAGARAGVGASSRVEASPAAVDPPAEPDAAREQLGLFSPRAVAETPSRSPGAAPLAPLAPLASGAPRPVVAPPSAVAARLAAVDPDALTPIEALLLVAELKQLAAGSGKM